MQPVKIITFVYIQVRLEIRGLDRNCTEPATMSGKGRPGDGPPPASGASVTGMAGSNPPTPLSSTAHNHNNHMHHCSPTIPPAPYALWFPFLVWHVCSTISLDYDLIYIVLAQSGLCYVHHPLI